MKILCLGIGIILGSILTLQSGSLALIGAGSYYLCKKATDRPQDLKKKITETRNFLLKDLQKLNNKMGLILVTALPWNGLRDSAVGSPIYMETWRKNILKNCIFGPLEFSVTESHYWFLIDRLWAC